MGDATGATATNLWVPGFRANLNLLPQQTKSRLLDAVDMDLAYDTPGQFFNADDVGTSNPQPVVSRAQASPDGFVDMTRRFGAFAPFNDGRFIDNEDLVRELEDPTSKVLQAMVAGMNRTRDVTILGTSGVGGLMGTFQQQTVTAGSPSYSTGSANSNVVASSYAGAHENETISATEGGDSNYGLTIGKLIYTKMQLDNAEIDEPEPGDDSPNLHFACTMNQLGNLLQSVPATSSFYNDVQGLIKGTLRDFLGFRFHRLPANAVANPIAKSSYTRKCMAWHKRAILYRARPIITAQVTRRADRSFRWYAYYEFEHGAVRRYDGGVWEVDCSETTTGPYG